jgi:Tol biopolymer transport system component
MIVGRRADGCTSRAVRLAAVGAVAVSVFLIGAGEAWATFPGAANGLIAFVRSGNIWTAKPDGTGQVRLTSDGKDQSPRWSPSGTRIAFERNGQVWTMNANGSGPTPITPGHEPTWSPDGRSLAFSNSVGDSCGDVAIDEIRSTAPYGPVVRLTHPANGCNTSSSDTDPSWSADGTNLIFSENSFGLTACTCFAGDALVYTFSTKATTTFSPNPEGTDFNALYGTNYGPGGRTMLYVYTPGQDGPDPYSTPGIYRDGPSGVSLIIASGISSTGKPTVANPTWAPHLGNELLYTDNSSSTPRIMVAPVAHGATGKQLIWNASEPDWQPVR